MSCLLAPYHRILEETYIQRPRTLQYLLFLCRALLQGFAMKRSQTDEKMITDVMKVSKNSLPIRRPTRAVS